MAQSPIVLSLITVFCWGFAALFDKLALAHLSPKAVYYARLYLAIVVLLGPMIMAWEETHLAMWKSDRRAILYLIGTVVFTYGGMYAYYYALSLSGASRIVPFCAAYPLIAFILAVFLLKEPVTATHILGTLFVAAGVILLGRS
jgi:drug/metabolite transporter (DMT)-like permease